ncbi:MAG: hypothetical protein ACO1RX_21615 [Candidatus Sericytochromatia bacterium]
MRRLARTPERMPELLSPEQLVLQRAPMVDPAALFKGVTLRASESAAVREAVAREGMKNPGSLFGEQQLAEPGQDLASPQALDLLPGLPRPPIVLAPLPAPPAERVDTPPEHPSPRTDSRREGPTVL